MGSQMPYLPQPAMQRSSCGGRPMAAAGPASPPASARVLDRFSLGASASLGRLSYGAAPQAPIPVPLAGVNIRRKDWRHQELELVPTADPCLVFSQFPCLGHQVCNLGELSDAPPRRQLRRP